MSKWKPSKTYYKQLQFKNIDTVKSVKNNYGKVPFVCFNKINALTLAKKWNKQLLNFRKFDKGVDTLNLQRLSEWLNNLMKT